MYCQQDFGYQMQSDYQEYNQQVVTYPTPPNIPPFHAGSLSPYSSNDRPQLSFRIEDILLQNKVGALNTYGNVYPNPTSQQYGTFQNGSTMHHVTCVSDREYPGINLSLLQIPGYYRKQNFRTTTGRKCRKPRTVFSELQLMVLEREFGEHKYLSTPQRTKLADRLGLNQTQVKTWYQNRRMKWKKESSDTSPDSKKSKTCEANNNNMEDMKMTADFIEHISTRNEV